jgi:hypothetical protein
VSRQISHICDEDLVLAADAELHGRRLREVREHLASCEECRTRLQGLVDTSSEVEAAYRQSLDSRLPHAAPARAALRAALSSSVSPGGTDSQRLADAWSATWLRCASTVAFLGMVVLGVAQIYRHAWLGKSSGSIAQVEAAPLPKPGITPGSALNIPDEICFVDRKEDEAAIPVAERKEVFREYGMDYRHAGDYEVDHLITPALGGTDDIRNLWPEPHGDTEWNSYVKDQLEDRLHDMVCSGQLDLPTAQRDIATDWITAYKHYFHTNAPLPRDRGSSRNG